MDLVLNTRLVDFIQKRWTLFYRSILVERQIDFLTNRIEILK